jgi:hypothetical protein
MNCFNYKNAQVQRYRGTDKSINSPSYQSPDKFINMRYNRGSDQKNYSAESAKSFESGQQAKGEMFESSFVTMIEEQISSYSADINCFNGPRCQMRYSGFRNSSVVDQNIQEIERNLQNRLNSHFFDNDKTLLQTYQTEIKISKIERISK